MAYGSLSQGVTLGLELLSLARRAPNKIKRSTPFIRSMTLETFATRSLVAVTLAASGWLFFYDLGCNQLPGSKGCTSFTHSGTQQFVRIVR